MRHPHVHRFGCRRAERGATLVLVVIAMAALIAMAGLALDVSHLMISKTRLQDTVDAAALSAASMLDETSSTSLATASALAAFGMNASAAGNQELSSSYSGGNITVTVQYSSALPPFTPGSTPARYVRVKATGFSFPAWLVQIVGITQLGVSATAVAGASPTANSACNIAPMMVCGNPSAGAAGLWGYTLNAPQSLKSAAPGSSAVGPGNFQLVQIGCTGGDCVRQNMAGSYSVCATSGTSIQTQPGSETGPVAQGLNTRFGQYSGPTSMSQDPPDVITNYQSQTLTAQSDGTIWQGSTQVTSSNINNNGSPNVYSYQDYRQDESNPAKYNYPPVSSNGNGVFNRRVLSVPVGDCSGTATGSTSVPVLGFACFFLLQPVTHQGTTNYVIGQFVGNCDVNGTPGPTPTTGPGPHVIELYHDPDSGDS